MSNNQNQRFRTTNRSANRSFRNARLPVRGNVQRRRQPRQGAAKRGETLQTFQVYAGTLKAAGLDLSIGPDPVNFGSQAIWQFACSWQLYRVVSYAVKYSTFLNQTKGAGTVYVWQSPDPASKLPTGDSSIKIACANSKGIQKFATQSFTHRPVVPTLRFNAFSTGGGDTGAATNFEPALKAFVAVTGGADTAEYGDVWIEMTLAFSGPAAPSTSVMQTGPAIPIRDVWMPALSDSDYFYSLVHGRFSEYLGILKADRYDVYQLDKGNQVLFTQLPDSSIIFARTIPLPDNPTHQPPGKLYKWDSEHNSWDGGSDIPDHFRLTYVKPAAPFVLGKTYTTQTTQPIRIDQEAQATWSQLDADDSRPMGRIAKDENGNDVLYYTIDQLKALHILVDDQPIKVDVATQPVEVTVSNDVDVNVINKPTVEADIINQPIQVQEPPNYAGCAMDIVGAII